MKPFNTYQRIPGTPMTPRDKTEVGSRFWNEGKWDNFVAPLLPDDCKDMTLIDMGCNAGLFLKLAEDRGFSRVVGVDSDKGAIERAIAYRERNGGKYFIQRRKMERSVDKLPMADFTILVNAHYYFGISDWIEYVDRLRSKTRYCIIVTTDRRRLVHKASPTTSDIKTYFKDWHYCGKVGEISQENDPRPRRLWTLCFNSLLIERVAISKLDNGNHQQTGFYEQLESGVKLTKTDYYRRMKTYRMKEHGWSKDQVYGFMLVKTALYWDVKENGLTNPIIVNSLGRIIDGSHRCEIEKYLGRKSVLVRRTA